VGDERPSGGFETAPERRRVRLPALIALASLVTLGAVLGVTSSGWFGAGPSDGPSDRSGVPPQAPEVMIFPRGRGPCVNDESRTCQNSRLFFRNARSLKERETVIRRRLRSTGFIYEGPFDRAGPNARGLGLLFRRGQDTAAVYLQPTAIAKRCPAIPLPRDRLCADILSSHS
jgi:hypothetical protein